MIRKLKVAAATAMLVLSAPSLAYAQNDATAEAATGEYGFGAAMVDEKTLIDMFAKIFGGTENAEPIDPAQLALAEATAGQILPDGTMKKMMGGMFDSIMAPMMEVLPEMSAMEIMGKTGVYEGLDELDDAKRKEITTLIDPIRKERAKKALDVMMPLLNDAMASLEAPMRTGLSRAYARKFSAQQLGEINAFFATPAGSFYASESYALQVDPEVMQATFNALPMMLKKIMSAAPEIEAQMKDLPKERGLKDLSDSELAKLAGLLGVTKETLEENREFVDMTAEAAADAMAAAADTADESAFPDETGQEPWYDNTNWESDERTNVQTLSDAHDAISEKSGEAFSAWSDAFDAAVAKSRSKYLADGWKPEAPDDSDED